jgi:hypothetical protein
MGVRESKRSHQNFGPVEGSRDGARGRAVASERSGSCSIYSIVRVVVVGLINYLQIFG